MYLKLASSRELPDFMTWSGRETLPLFWLPFRSPAFAIAAALVVPGLIAAILGYLVFRSRIQGVYFSIITQALTLIVSILFIGQQSLTGGTNGITDLSKIFGVSRTAPRTQTGLYLATVICLLGVYLLCRWIVDSRFGRLLVAMRDNEARVRLLGYNPVVLKSLVFALSAAIAGLAGALFVPQVGIISPSALGVVPSVEIVIWVAVGGRGWLVGALLGALLVNWGKTVFSESFPNIWQYGYGALLIGTVVLFPEGLTGFLVRLPSWWRRQSGATPGETRIHGAELGATPESSET
jgi:urea transport system permease protein